MQKSLNILFLLITISLFWFLNINIAFAKEEKNVASGPVKIRNQMPLYLFYLFPLPDKAQTLKKNEIQIDFSYQVSNIISWDREANQYGDNTRDACLWWVFLDLEVNRFDLNLSYGLFDNYEIGIDIPYYYFSGGYLDGFIETFENIFPSIDTPLARQIREKFTYKYEFIHKGQPIIVSESKPSGLGDVSLYLKAKIVNESKWIPKISLMGYIKIPTASDDLLGSQKNNFSAGILFDKSLLDDLYFYLNFNVIFVEKPDILRIVDNFNNFIYSGLFCFEYFITDSNSLLFQTAMHSTVYNGSISTVEENHALLATLAFNHNFNKNISFQFGLNENINAASPDFGLFTSIKIKL